jgi:hypothetical protein
VPLIAGKGYDTDTLIEAVRVKGICAVSLPKKKRTAGVNSDRHFREGYVIECFIDKIKW